MAVQIQEEWDMVRSIRRFSCALVVVVLAGCGRSEGTEPSPTVNLLTISPPSLTIVQGDSARFTTRGLDSPSRPMGPTNITWRSSNTSVATVDNSGMVRGIGAGNATMTATASGLSVSALVVVTAPARQQRVEATASERDSTQAIPVNEPGLYRK